MGANVRAMAARSVDESTGGIGGSAACKGIGVMAPVANHRISATTQRRLMRRNEQKTLEACWIICGLPQPPGRSDSRENALARCLLSSTSGIRINLAASDDGDDGRNRGGQLGVRTGNVGAEPHIHRTGS